MTASLQGCLGYSRGYSRYLEGACAQDSGPLVLGHVGGGDPLLVSRLPLSRREDLHVLLSLLGKPAQRYGSAAPQARAAGEPPAAPTSSAFSRSSRPSSSSTSSKSSPSKLRGRREGHVRQRAWLPVPNPNPDPDPNPGPDPNPDPDPDPDRDPDPRPPARPLPPAAALTCPRCQTSCLLPPRPLLVAPRDVTSSRPAPWRRCRGDAPPFYPLLLHPPSPRSPPAMAGSEGGGRARYSPKTRELLRGNGACGGDRP